MTASRNEILLAVLPAIRWHANRRTRLRVDPDDLAQESCLAFLQRFREYDGVHASTFARWMVGHARRRFVNTKRFRAVRLPGGLPDWREGDRPTERAEDAAALAARLVRLRAAVEQLPAVRREIVTRRYGLDGTAPALLRDLHCGTGRSRQATHQQEAKALAQLALALARSDTPTQETAHVA